MFDIVQNSLKFLLEIMMFESSANMGSDKVFIVGGMSFMYALENKCPRIDLWGYSCLVVPQFEKILIVIL
jgi:hypothetical protein